MKSGCRQALKAPARTLTQAPIARRVGWSEYTAGGAASVSEMKRAAFLFVLLAVVACAPVASGPQVVYDPDISVQEAQRRIDRATAEAAQVATAAAISTAVRADALASATAEWAATSQAISIQSTQAAAQWTATAAAISAQRTEGAATLEADATRGAATQRAVGTATEQIIQAEKRAADQRMETMRSEAFFWGGLIFVAGLTIILLFGFAAVLTAGERVLLAMAQARFAQAGQMAIITLPDGSSYDVVERRVIEGRARHVGEIAAPEDDRTIPVNGRAPGQIRMNVSEAERLLTDACVAGYGPSDIIPPAHKINWSGGRRRVAIKTISEWVRTERGSPENGGGTFILPPYKTCADLLNAIHRNEVTPAPLGDAPVEVANN